MLETWQTREWSFSWLQLWGGLSSFILLLCRRRVRTRNFHSMIERTNKPPFGWEKATTLFSLFAACHTNPHVVFARKTLQPNCTDIQTVWSNTIDHKQDVLNSSAMKNDAGKRQKFCREQGKQAFCGRIQHECANDKILTSWKSQNVVRSWWERILMSEQDPYKLLDESQHTSFGCGGDLSGGFFSRWEWVKHKKEAWTTTVKMCLSPSSRLLERQTSRFL